MRNGPGPHGGSGRFSSASVSTPFSMTVMRDVSTPSAANGGIARAEGITRRSALAMVRRLVSWRSRACCAAVSRGSQWGKVSDRHSPHRWASTCSQVSSRRCHICPRGHINQ